MAAGLSAVPVFKPFPYFRASNHFPKPMPTSLFSIPSAARYPSLFHGGLRKTNVAVCFVLEDTKQSVQIDNLQSDQSEEVNYQILTPRAAERLARKKSEMFTYLVAAMMSSFGITSMAVMACYYRFYWQMEVGMEFWARWAHRALWHASLWHMHESHHRPREGPFELNDVFAIINAIPAIGLLSFGFFNKGLFPGLCFGAGLGITVFGMAYMFVHDGLVHKRFPVGPIANVPYFRKVAAAHQVNFNGVMMLCLAGPLLPLATDSLHHSDKFNGVPYGLFLGPKEVEEVGGHEELEKEINRRIKLQKGS
ncbi:beta-carotene hydroxylase 2, chloroplastic isoform X2 [Manihot esculenta]|uniref:beta-carotene hydroxylase 2, chloroplastic isoform X2 n=1 Tax=Manihot esculenta TaxID=3983 RepID=UPI001CC3E09A|nr:beta-carotene hydroxylase 2, chloroplastic isoform X2 [Manihot esculenta]